MEAAPRLIYGTAWKKERTRDLVARAVRAGFRALDTAGQPKHYDEQGVGLALEDLARDGIARESLFVQTKFTPPRGQDPARVPYDPGAALSAQVAQSFAASCRNLGTGYVDSLVLHSPLETAEETLEAWRAMEEIHRRGGAKRLGLSNCYELEPLKELYDASSVKPSVLQNRFYQDTGYDREIRAWTAAKGVQYQSFWTLTANPHVLAGPVVRRIAENSGKTPAQIFFRYLSQIGVVPLTGTTSERHMREDLAIFDFELSPVELESVSALLS